MIPIVHPWISAVCPRPALVRAAARPAQRSSAPAASSAGLASFALAVFLPLTLPLAVAEVRAEALPVLDPATLGWTEQSGHGVTNLLSQEMLLRCVHDGDANGLTINLAGEPVLLDGTTVDTTRVEGTVWTAPWPLAGTRTEWDACQFRSGTAIRSGRGKLSIARLANDDDPGWFERGHIVVRLQLSLVQDGADRDLGTYEFLVGFRRDGEFYRRSLTVVEGPFVANIRSETPDRVAIVFRTEPAAFGSVLVREARPDAAARPPLVFASPSSKHHEVELRGLKPDTEYLYRVEVDGRATPAGWEGDPRGGRAPSGDGWASYEYRYRTAPQAGQGTTRFAYAGDSRMGPGGGLRAFMGVNALVFPQELNAAWRMGARFLLHGGDLVSGYTSVAADFRAQLRAFKWIATPFLRGLPIYTAIGNHDALVRMYAGPDKRSTGLDRWPYATESTEAIWADELVQPDNSPVPFDLRRPPYRETAFSFSYGPTRIVVLNNNYWTSPEPGRFGGSPEGFLFPDQMAWLRTELERADADPTVRHVFLCVHEPPFPNSAHLDDAMWYEGNLAERGYAVPPEGGNPRPEAMGVVETRNEMLRLAAASRKVVAILGSDEHNYSRMLLTPEMPAGDPARDDPDGDGKLNSDRLSPVPGLRRPIWLVISGGAGAPHYAEEPSPWNIWWKADQSRCREAAGCYFFSPLNHWIFFEDDGQTVSLRCYTPAGDLIDEVDDLVRALR